MTRERITRDSFIGWDQLAKTDSYYLFEHPETLKNVLVKIDPGGARNLYPCAEWESIGLHKEPLATVPPAFIREMVRDLGRTRRVTPPPTRQPAGPTFEAIRRVVENQRAQSQRDREMIEATMPSPPVDQSSIATRQAQEFDRAMERARATTNATINVPEDYRFISLDEYNRSREER